MKIVYPSAFYMGSCNSFEGNFGIYEKNIN